MAKLVYKVQRVAAGGPYAIANVPSFVVTKGRQQVQDPYKTGTAVITGRIASTVSSLNIGDTIQIRTTTFNGSTFDNIFYVGLISDISIDYGYTSNMDTWAIQVEDGLRRLSLDLFTHTPSSNGSVTGSLPYSRSSVTA